MGCTALTFLGRSGENFTFPSIKCKNVQAMIACRQVLCSSGKPFSSSQSSLTKGSPPASTMTVPIDRKLRFLCLHGYLQNSEIFKNRIGSLRKALKSRAEFVFVDAPFLAEAENAEELREAGGGDHGRSWWQWMDLEPGTRPSRAAQYSGWEASQAAIAKALEEHHPVDGLLGFSQGATAAALFLSHAPPAAGLRAAVLIGGFLPRDASYAAAIQAARPSLPSLMVCGAGDTLVPEERTRQLAEAFADGAVQVYVHPGGHMVPTCSGEFKQTLAAFLDAARQTA